MRITRQRLKDIITEEINRFDEGEETLEVGNAPSNSVESREEIDSITESAGWEIAQQLADTLIASGVVDGNPQEVTTALMGLTKLGINLLGATVAGGAAAKAFEAFKKLRQDSSSEPAESEETEWISGPGLKDREPEVYQEQEDAVESPSRATGVTGNSTLDTLINQAIQEELALLRSKKIK